MTDQYEELSKEILIGHELEGYFDCLKEAISQALRTAAEQEREACAKIAEGKGYALGVGGEIWIASKIASAIRHRTKNSSHD